MTAKNEAKNKDERRRAGMSEEHTPDEYTLVRLCTTFFTIVYDVLGEM